MAKVGDWLRIDEMRDEPQYTGKIGQVDHIDSKGYIHGTWGGCSILPEDKYTLLSEEEAKKLIEEEKQRKLAAIPPKWELPNEKYEIKCEFMAVPTRLQRLNGIMPHKVHGAVSIEPNGAMVLSHKYGQTIRALKGVKDSDCQMFKDFVLSKLKQDCCFSVRIQPEDILKDNEEVKAAIEKLFEAYPELAK